ncbi:(-)-germacrene D synthase-like isoform X2 [Nicotiana tomentosiformis]|uniref:(-)-germacrene D synthase-like isoform X2 n=1 Tax=Nicotiana tomentosiformis TaxID=4098 RepID=UPI00388C69DD
MLISRIYITQIHKNGIKYVKMRENRGTFTHTNCIKLLLQGANEWEKKQHEHLKEEVRKMLEMSPSKSLQTLDLINAIQCLEVAYHFEYLGNTVIMSHLMFLGSSLTAKEITIKHWLATWKGC